ncbi:MAG: HAMP domain-containing histidine kinase [Ruminococcus sp.]|nr:HAMP domain-containing histidine kinase [Ruminococcus sp.]
MKGKGYRSSSVKAIWIVIAHLAAVAAAVCAAMFVMIYQTGIRLDDRGKSYTESEAFEKQVSNRGSDILVSLAAQDDINYLKNAGSSAVIDAQDDINYLKNAGSSAVIDLAEFEEKGNTRDSIRDLSLKNTSGLAYSVSDLLEWGKDWEANYYEGVYDEDSQVIRCESSDGTSHYFYRTDFKKMVADGTLKINYNTDFLEEDDFESKTESEKLDTVADELYYRYTSQSENIGNVTDTRTNTEYPGCFFVELSQLDEKFAPQGAENILDAVNKSTEWNGRLEDAYKELFTLLDCIRAIQSDEQFNDYETSLASVFHSVGDYTEGSTNLTYLFADKETQTIYTNKKAYSSYAQLEQNLEKIFKEKAYAVVYPELSECVTNIPGADLQVWNHTIDQSFDTKDFVFAVSVDTKFSVADSMADEAENYETYSKLMFPMLAGAIFGSVLWLIGMVWLTVTAGRRPEDEEIHLNGFDRWYTEIAAGTVIGIWLAGTIISGTLIANSSLGYSHVVVTVIVICLICGTYTMAWFLIGYLSLVRRIKAGTLWKNSLIRKVLKWIGKCSGKLADFARAFSRNTAEKIKVLLVGGAFLFLQFLIIGCVFSGAGVFLLALMAVDVAVMIFAIRKADGLDLIMDGLKKISDGELQYKIKTDTLTGKQKVMAEYINNIGSGLDAAVENSLKKERMQTELITNVSHDLKTPLTSIINYVDLMKRENPTDPKIQEYLRILDEKSQRLKVLTEDVVEASKASTGNIKLEMNDIDFVEMVQQVIGEFEEKFKEKNLTMMVHFTDEPSIIYADGQRMWRVLENVFGNVVKYAMEGTRVYAEISNRNKKVTFSLKNISAQPLNISADELTERFIRGDVARNTEGSGLGLSIAKSLTELQGGEFKLYLDGDLFKVMITFVAKNYSK